MVIDAINGMKINDDLELSITYISGLYSIKPAGVYTYTINKSDISGYNSSLHDVTINAGTLTVTKKNIYISVPSVVCSLTSYETKVDVISAAVDAVLASCDPNMVVTYNVNPSVEYLLEGTYSLAAYVSFNLSDSNNYNIIISSIGTITVVA